MGGAAKPKQQQLYAPSGETPSAYTPDRSTTPASQDPIVQAVKDLSAQSDETRIS